MSVNILKFIGNQLRTFVKIIEMQNLDLHTYKLMCNFSELKKYFY